MQQSPYKYTKSSASTANTNSNDDGRFDPLLSHSLTISSDDQNFLVDDPEDLPDFSVISQSSQPYSAFSDWWPTDSAQGNNHFPASSQSKLPEINYPIQEQKFPSHSGNTDSLFSAPAMADSPVLSPTLPKQNDKPRESVASAHSDDGSYYSDEYSDDYSDSYDSRSYSGSDYDSYSDRDSYSDYSDQSRSRSRSVSRSRSPSRSDSRSQINERSRSRENRSQERSSYKLNNVVIEHHLSVPKVTDGGHAFQELDSTLNTFSDFLQGAILNPSHISDSQSMNSVQIHSLSESLESAGDSEPEVREVTVATKIPILLDDDSLSKPFSQEINLESFEFEKKLAESLKRYRRLSQESVDGLVVEPSKDVPTVSGLPSTSQSFDVDFQSNSLSLSRPTGTLDDQYDPLDFVGE
ncbi:hypothetical protein HK096_009418, partial [Nowakowskiella sp. JEL0078]